MRWLIAPPTSHTHTTRVFSLDNNSSVPDPSWHSTEFPSTQRSRVGSSVSDMCFDCHQGLICTMSSRASGAGVGMHRSLQ